MNPFDRKDPFTRDTEPQDAATLQQAQHLDLSTLSDEDRAFYLTYGKLPHPSQSSNSKVAALSKEADDILADFQPKQTISIPKEVQPEPLEVTPPPVQTPVQKEVSDADVMQERPFIPDTQESKVVTNWDEEVVPTSTPVEETQSIPTPTVEEVPPVEDRKEDRVEETPSIHGLVGETPVSAQEERPVEPTPGEKTAVYTAPADPTPPRLSPVDIATDTTTEKESIITETPTPPTQKTVTSISAPAHTSQTEAKTETTTEEDTYQVRTTDSEDSGNTLESMVDKYWLVAPDETVDTVYKNFEKSVLDLANKYNTDEASDAEEYRRVLSNPDGPYMKQELLANKTTASRDMEQRIINTLDLQKLKDTIPDSIKPRNSNAKIDTSNLKSEEKIVKGKQAKMLVLAKLRGTKRVHLANSGFYVDVRPLTNLELSEYINTLTTSNMEFGKILGGYFYIYAHMFVEKFFAERLTNIVVGSNLQGWTQGTTLQDTFSLQDFRTLMWACADLMFKDGVDFTKICSFCSHTEKVTMNLSKLYYVNHEAMTSAVEYISKKKTVTPDDCTEYRNRLDFGVPSTFRIGDWQVRLKVPSLSEYLNYANMFYNDLLAHVTDTKNMDTVRTFIRNTYFRHYAPWIKDISALEEDGGVSFRISSIDDIFDNVNSIFEDSSEFITKLEEYIQKTMLTYIAFPYIACPKCGKVPENIVNGFVAYDIETAFFTIAVRKLQKNSSRLTDTMLT